MLIKEYREYLARANTANIKNNYAKDRFYVIVLISFALLQSFINIFACFLFILEGYHEKQWISDIGLFIAVYFTCEMAVNFYNQPKPKYLYILNMDNWVDFMTVLPEYLSLFLQSSGKVNVGFLRILRVFRIMRIVKFRKTLKKMQVGKKTRELNLENHSLSRLKREFIMLIISLFATLFIAAGIVLFLQDSFSHSINENLAFADAFYDILQTVSTIGYGDILMIKDTSRIIFSIMLVIIFTIFGNQISKIVSTIKESDKFDIKYNLAVSIHKLSRIIGSHYRFQQQINFSDYFIFAKLHSRPPRLPNSYRGRCQH